MVAIFLRQRFREGWFTQTVVFLSKPGVGLSLTFQAQSKVFEYPTVTIVILNYNGRRFLDACFSSLRQISYPVNRLEVVMVDNCSLDGSVDYVKQTYPWVRVIPLKRNFGFTGGNNIGVRFAKGKFVVLLNNDVVVDKLWLVELVRVALGCPGSIITSKALFLHKPEEINNDGSKATLIGRGFCPNCGRKHSSLPGLKEEQSLVVQPYGASMLVQKSVYEELGGFDEDYFTSLEDLDLGLRSWLTGHRVIYVPSSIFYHVAGGTAGKGSHLTSAMVYHNTKNSYMNILKCFDLRHILLGISFSLAYYLESAIWLTLKTGRLEDAVLILKGHVWVLKNFGRIYAKRVELGKRRRLKYSFLFRREFFALPSEMVRAHFSLRVLLEKLW